MRKRPSITRPQRLRPAPRRISRPTLATKHITRPNSIDPLVPKNDLADNAAPSAESVPDPYVDYGRTLTSDGGILICFKDIDERLRHTLWRVFAWLSSTGLEALYLSYHSIPHQDLTVIGCLVAVAIINWLIVAIPIELYRSIEIRPDCMIIEGTDVFWLRSMECGWPKFRMGKDKSRILCGVYGTRFVEYLTIRPFDELDRGPEVFAAHLQDAMQQLWTKPA